MSGFKIAVKPLDIMRSMAEKVRALRKQSGLSQQELARRSGVSFGSLRRFESSGEISFESLLKIANVFNRLDDFNHVLELRDDPERIRKLFDNPQTWK